MSRPVESRYRALLSELVEMGRADLRDDLRVALDSGDDDAVMVQLQRVYTHLDRHEDVVASAILHACAAMDTIRQRRESQRMVAELAKEAGDMWGAN